MKLNILILRRLSLVVGALTLVTTLSATDVPKNLGNGLDKLVESRVALKKAQANNTRIQTFNGFATEQAANYDGLAIKDRSAPDRYIVDIHPSGRVSLDTLKQMLATKFPTFKITAIDEKYREVGVIEGYMSIDDVAAAANLWEIRSIQLGLKPYFKKAKVSNIPKLLAKNAPSAPDAVTALTFVGTAFDQGVTQHRVDKLSNIYDTGHVGAAYNGEGITLGGISDSYDTRVAAPHAAQDVANNDLPGNSVAPNFNGQPVFLVEDDTGAATDEARGIVQILYKLCPKARLGVATANLGEVDFANNIRKLANVIPNGASPPFKADAICDDVGYFDEPWYQDGIIGAGVDDAYAAGVAYFSSAANDIGTNGYTSVLRWVPNGTGVTAATNTALAGTNIDLTGVPTNLYAGGFHNFNPTAGQQDTAQTWSLPGAAQNFVMQWDDPYDQNTHSVNDSPAIYQNNGTITATVTTITFTDIPALTAGQLYEVDMFHTSGDLDSIVTVRDPSNNTIISQDSTIDEVVHFFAPVSGSGYSITETHFGATTGNFHVDMFHSTGYNPQLLTSNLNLLVFRIDTGAYVGTSSLTADNFATNQPIELGTVTRPSGQTGVQFMIARSNVPAGQGPTHVRMLDPGNGAGSIGPMEYFTYDTVTTGGHATANGCNGTAAYSVFRPSRPETFTSPGPAIYYFDKMSNRLNPPQVRLQPRIAAADAANTSFFTSDSALDGDSNPNFSGTSAAGPHAAACAGLVIQAHGGPGSLTPDQTRDILQRTTFIHDLDPLFASGSASASNGGTVTITISSDSSNITGPAGSGLPGIGMQDPNSWKVAYSGPGFLTSLVFNAAGTAATGGSPTSGNNGLEGSGPNNTTAPFNNYFSNIYPGCIFAPATKNFTLGTLNGLVAGDITQPQSTTPFTGFSNLAPLPSNGTNQFWTMAIGFPNSNFTAGKSMNFTVGRGQQHAANVGTFGSPTGGNPFAGPNSGATSADATADLLGGGVLIPEGTVTPNGMAFSGTISDGVNTFPFSGTINNRLGTGYTVQDGYGFINCEAAAAAPIAGPSAVTFNGAASRKTHGGAGAMDIALPGIECRNGGATGDFTVVFKFANPLTSVGFAQVVGGYGSVTSATISGSEYIVNLTGVTNAQSVNVAVIDVADNAGNKSPQFTTTLSALRGDTTGDGQVNAADIGQTKARSGAAVDGTNFRNDVTVDGIINAADIGLVKANSGIALP